MSKTIRINGLSEASINAAVQELWKYARWVEKKEAELRSRLAALGASVARVRFAQAVYDGDNDVLVDVDDTGSVAVIYAKGEAVAFIEFGSGAAEGYGHPLAGKFGMGPSTWSLGDSGKGHWDNPEGWYYAHGKKSKGNPPAMAMVTARDAMVENLTMIAREVFGSHD